jgi:CheY-like chemotaxis protein/HPt (histidine-containing phosphotransfer) domain-containing protein
MSNRKIEGIGLGLSITKMILDMMGGNISVESEYGKGSVFTVKLPQKNVTNEKIGADIVNSIKNFHYASGRHSQKPLPRVLMPYAHVLLVDDVATNLDVARGMMKPYRMQIDCVGSGQEAVNAVRNGNVKYNAIFMDHMMPGIDGIEATRIIREEIGNDYARNVPIIALTANAITGNEEMFLSKGFQAFISKPIDTKCLDAVINQWVRDEELEKDLPQITEEDDDPGQNRRSGVERRDGIDRRMLANDISGLDMNKGQECFGDMETYVEVLRSYIVNTRPLLEAIKEVDKGQGLDDYIITVHGIKGSSRGIFAEEAGDRAEALEKAAKAGDFGFVAANNAGFIEYVSMLVADIENALDKNIEKKERPKKDKPDMEVLLKLLAACKNYKTSDMEEAMAIIESFEYESDDGLAHWLRENVDQLNYSEIVEKLSALRW